MLQPSDSPARGGSAEVLSLPEHRGEEKRKTERPTIWKWISLRELLFIFAACSVGAALFQAQDDVRWVELPYTVHVSYSTFFLTVSDLSMRGVGIWTHHYIATESFQRKMRDCACATTNTLAITHTIPVQAQTDCN